MAELMARIDPADEDDEEAVAGLARRLRAELLDLDVAAVEPVPEPAAPAGTKGLGALLGTLAVKLGPAALKAVVTKIRDWASRNGRSVEVTLDGDTVKLTGATSEQQELLLNAWLARHAPGA
jgi:hypothetical protein